MKNVTVEVCCGTACYLLGAAKLLNLENEVPPDWKPHLKLRALPCLNLCETENLGGAPFVRLNGSEILARATLEELKLRLAELLNGDE